MPRGKTITAAQCEQFLALVAAGNTITAAAEQLGLTASPFYRRLREDDAFAELANVEVRPQFRDRLEQTLLDIALGRIKPTHASQVTALIIALKRYDPDYRESQQRLEITGDGGGPVQVESRGVSLGELIAFAAVRGIDVDARLDHQPARALPAPGEVRASDDGEG